MHPPKAMPGIVGPAPTPGPAAPSAGPYYHQNSYPSRWNSPHAGIFILEKYACIPIPVTRVPSTHPSHHTCIRSSPPSHILPPIRIVVHTPRVPHIRIRIRHLIVPRYVRRTPRMLHKRHQVEVTTPVGQHAAGARVDPGKGDELIVRATVAQAVPAGQHEACEGGIRVAVGELQQGSGSLDGRGRRGLAPLLVGRVRL